ncbi:MAG: flexitail domain-containing putative surface protein [Dehalococcoidia bacterium]
MFPRIGVALLICGLLALTGTNGQPPRPARATGAGTSAVSPGGLHTCALTTAGGVWCWGDNTYGQLGKVTLSSASPVGVTGLSSGVAAIAAGVEHTCALTEGGGVKCWGRNVFGQLGDGLAGDSAVPLDVPGLTSGVAAIGSGNYHTCAVLTSGGVTCWGSNGTGQLGNGSTTTPTMPVNAVGLTSGVAAISGGASHTCALLTGGGVKCWGFNLYGQLGDGTMTNSSTPIDVTGLTSGAISAGGYHTCALTTGGGVKCWGVNSSGQIGDGGGCGGACATPVDVTGLTGGAAAVSAGEFHTCALTAAGGLKCWGKNDDGQLGDGSTSGSSLPVAARGLPTKDPKAGFEIAFSSDRDGNNEIYAMGADGSLPTRLTYEDSSETEPSYSPDGTKIAFESDLDSGGEDIYVMNADGSGLWQRLTTDAANDIDPAWSPDGSKITFASMRDGNYNVYVMNADGSGQTPLTTDGGQDTDPAWSPDGTKIAFVSGRDAQNEVYVMNANGTGQANLTNNVALDAGPAWSPDGTKIAFHSNRSGALDIFAMNTNGTNQTNVTNDAAEDAFPVWKTDSAKIAFRSDRDGNYEIYVADAGGTGQTRLTHNPSGDDQPAWRRVSGSGADYDQDGCTDAQEANSDQVMGGRRNPQSFWDFFDVPVGSPLARDQAVTAGDVAGVVARFGATGNADLDPLSPPGPAPAYHPAYDRGGVRPGGERWSLLPADGSITAGDVAAAVVQFGHTCA